MPQTTHRGNPASTGVAGVFLWAVVWIAGTSAICWVAINRYAPQIEDRILSGVQSALKPLTKTTPVIASIHGRDAVLTGRVTDDQHRAALISAVEAAPGVRLVDDQMTLIESRSVDDPVIPSGDADSSESESDSKNGDDAATTLTVIDSTSSESSSEPTTSLTENVTAVTVEEPSWPDEKEELADIKESGKEEIKVAMIDPDDSNTLTPVEMTSDLLTPSLDFNIEGKTLAVSGRLSDGDDAAPLIRAAMRVFDLDYISNTIEISDDTASASWLESVSDFLPNMASIENPSIEIKGDEIRLGGNASDTDEQESVLDAAVSALGSYEMTEEFALPTTTDDSSSDSTSSAAVEVDNTTSEQTETPEASTTEASVIASAPSSVSIAEADVELAKDVNADSDSDVDTDTDTQIATNTNIVTEDSDATGRPTVDSADQIDTSTTVASLANAFEQLPSMDVLFESNSDILTIESLDVLDSIATVLQAHPEIPINIEGHTDASGETANNLALSQLRANSVRDYLVDRGVSIYRLKAYGFGEGVPVSENSTPEGRADNRRIEFNFQR